MMTVRTSPPSVATQQPSRTDCSATAMVRRMANLPLSPSRRAFLWASCSLPFAVRAQATPATPKRLLVLGGTGFIGPHIIDAALRRGFVVTLFHRGKTNPTLFEGNPKVERILGDRNVGFEALAGKKWDAVVDTSAYFPRQIEQSAKALKDSVKQYVFVSSVSVYKDPGKPLDESAPVGTIADPTIEKITEGSYGPLKALCEQAATRIMEGRALNVRPGYIIGPRISAVMSTPNTLPRSPTWPAAMKESNPAPEPTSTTRSPAASRRREKGLPTPAKDSTAGSGRASTASCS